MRLDFSRAAFIVAVIDLLIMVSGIELGAIVGGDSIRRVEQ